MLKSLYLIVKFIIDTQINNYKKIREYRYLLSYFSILMLLSCTSKTLNVENDKKATLKSFVRLEVFNEKRFSLDNSSAPRVSYTQIF